MSANNNCMFSGRIGRIEMRYLPSGSAVTNVNLALDNSYVNKQGEKIEETVWIQLTAFEKTAESINKHFSVGDQMIVQAKATGASAWINKESGEPKAAATFRVDSFTFGAKGKNSGDQVDG